MARARKPSMPDPVIVPMLKTVEQMSQYSGIGINRLRELINDGEIEYVRNGNRYSKRHISLYLNCSWRHTVQAVQRFQVQKQMSFTISISLSAAPANFDELPSTLSTSA